MHFECADFLHNKNNNNILLKYKTGFINSVKQTWSGTFYDSTEKV